MADIRFKIQQFDAGAAHWLGWAKKEVRRLAELMPAFTRTWVHGDVTVRAQYHEGSGTARLWLAAAAAMVVVRNCFVQPSLYSQAYLSDGIAVCNLKLRQSEQEGEVLDGVLLNTTLYAISPVYWGVKGAGGATLAALKNLAEFWLTADLGLASGLIIRSMRESDGNSFVSANVTGRVQNHGGKPYLVVTQQWTEVGTSSYTHTGADGISTVYARDTPTYGVQVIDFGVVQGALPRVEEVELAEDGASADVTWVFLGETLKVKMSVQRATGAVQQLKGIVGEEAAGSSLNMRLSEDVVVRCVRDENGEWQRTYDADAWLSGAAFDVFYTGDGGHSLIETDVRGRLLVLAGTEVFRAVLSQPFTNVSTYSAADEWEISNGVPDEYNNYSVNEKHTVTSASIVTSNTSAVHTPDTFGLVSFSQSTLELADVSVEHTTGMRSNGYARYTDTTLDVHNTKQSSASKTTYFLSLDTSTETPTWQLATVAATLQQWPQPHTYSADLSYGIEFYGWSSWSFETPATASYNHSAASRPMQRPGTTGGHASRYSNGYLYYPSITTYPVSSYGTVSQTGVTMYYSYESSQQILEPYVYGQGTQIQRVSASQGRLKGVATVPELGLYIGSTYMYRAGEGLLFGALTTSQQETLLDDVDTVDTYTAEQLSTGGVGGYDLTTNTTATGTAIFAGGGGGSRTVTSVRNAYWDYEPANTGIDRQDLSVLAHTLFTATWVWNGAGGVANDNLLIVTLLVEPFAQVMTSMRNVKTATALDNLRSSLAARKAQLIEAFDGASADEQAAYVAAEYDPSSVREKYDDLLAACESWYVAGEETLDTEKRNSDMSSRRSSRVLWCSREVTVADRLLDWCITPHAAVVHPASAVLIQQDEQD